MRTASKCGWVVAVSALGFASPARGQQQADPLAPLVAEAVQKNLVLASQRLALARADAGVTEARAAVLPSLGFDARYTSAVGNVIDIGDLVNPAFRALNQITATSNFPTDISLRQPLAQSTMLRVTQPLFAPAAIAGIRLARTQRALDERALALAARALDADVRLAYLAYARAAQLDTLLTSTRALIAEGARVNDRLLANGRATPDAVARSAADLSDIDQQSALVAAGARAAARGFNALLDRPLDTALPVIPGGAYIAAEFPTRDATVAAALQRREELAQASLGTDAAELQTRLAQTAFLPVVALVVDYGVTGATYDFNSRRDVLFTTLSVQWNLFRGGADRARVQQSSLDTERARLQRRALEQQVRLDAENAWERAQVARDAIATAEARLTSASTSFRLVQRRYAEGLASNVELIDARSAFTSARVNRVITEYDYHARRVELDRAAALTPSPLTAITR